MSTSTSTSKLSGNPDKTLGGNLAIDEHPIQGEG